VKDIARNSAAFIFSLYALVTFFLASFVLMWNNKGAASIWDKSSNDWVSLLWLLTVSIISSLSARHCYRNKHINYILLICLLIAVIVNMAYVFSWGQDQALLYYGLVHGVVLVGCGLWWYISFATKP
jgi:hypothetical protein